jgi:energy-coupling factor transport system permease protein
MYLYREVDSVFHRLHPVTKLLMLALFITMSFLAKKLPWMICVLAGDILLLLVAGGGRNLRTFWKMLIIFWVFTFAIWVVVPRLQHLPWSFSIAALLATRIDTFVISGLFFVTITRIEEFTLALTKIGIPYKAAFALSLGFRLVPLFYQNLQTIVAAQESRGVDLKSGGILRKAQSYIPIFGVLMSYSIRNADLMAMSLEAKGFGYSTRRTSFLQPKFGAPDLIVLFSGVALCILLTL